jgi:spore maturation protein CgeB
MDTPVTINSIIQGLIPFYFPENGLGEFDAALSYTGGKALEIQKTLLCAKKSFPLYGSVDPNVHYPVTNCTKCTGLLSYLGTYAIDRQWSFKKLFLEPARQLSQSTFLLGGSQYPSDINLSENVVFIEHVVPEEHSFFYSSCLFTLNITRSMMAEFGYCPSGRLFEAAACGVPIISDYWEGLDTFFETSTEILIAESTELLINNLTIDEGKRESISKLAIKRVLSDHTSDNRANDFLKILSQI